VLTKAIRRYWTPGCCALLLLGLSGCMASESQQGDTFVYKNTILKTLLLLGIAGALLVFGVGILWESLKGVKPKKKRRTSDRRKRRKPAASTSPGKKIAGIGFGAGLSFGGMLVLVLGVPSSLMQHITVSQDRVTMQVSVLWFSASEKEILFSSITGLDKQEEEVAGRRGTKVKATMFINHAGGAERIEMGPLEKAAYPKIVELLAAYRAADGDVGAGENVVSTDPTPVTDGTPTLDETVRNVVERGTISPRNGSTNPGDNPGPSTPLDASGLTPTESIGRYFKGGQVAMRDRVSRRAIRATIIEVYVGGKLKVRSDVDASQQELLTDIRSANPLASAIVPPPTFGPGSPVDPQDPPAVGSILLSSHAGRWFEVELIHSMRARSVIKWVGEDKRFIVSTSLLRVPPAEGTKPYIAKRYNPTDVSGLTPVGRLGSVAVGDEVYFHEGATSRKVVVVQPYQEGAIKVRVVQTQEDFFVFIPELRRRP
jgi:hypothetical protein